MLSAYPLPRCACRCGCRCCRAREAPALSWSLPQTGRCGELCSRHTTRSCCCGDGLLAFAGAWELCRCLPRGLAWWHDLIHCSHYAARRPSQALPDRPHHPSCSVQAVQGRALGCQGAGGALRGQRPTCWSRHGGAERCQLSCIWHAFPSNVCVGARRWCAWENARAGIGQRRPADPPSGPPLVVIRVLVDKSRRF